MHEAVVGSVPVDEVVPVAELDPLEPLEPLGEAVEDAPVVLVPPDGLAPVVPELAELADVPARPEVCEVDEEPPEHPTRVVTVSMTAAARNRIATKAKRSRSTTAASSARAAVPNTRDRSVVGVEHQHHLRFGETGDQEQRVV